MRNNPDDLANQLIQKVKDYLQKEIDDKELAEVLLWKIDKWENEND